MSKKSNLINWALFEKYNSLDARLRPNALNQLGIQVKSNEIRNILAKSHFVIPGKTRFQCQQCGECCRYARKIAELTYEPCPYLTEDNKCERHDENYLVCKWFPFFIVNDPKYGSLLTIKPYCSGYGKGPVINYHQTVRRMKELQRRADTQNDGAFVIHEVLYLEQYGEWVFPSRKNIDTLLDNVRKNSSTKFHTPQNLKDTELAHAQKFTNMLLGGVYEPQITLDEGCYITDMNEAFSVFLGMPQSIIRGKHIGELFIDGKKLEQELKLSFLSGRMNALPQHLKVGDGKTVSVLLNAITFRSRRDGQVHGLLLSVKEVDERTYSRISHSRNYARGLIEANLDLLVFIESDGIISDVNKACCDMLSKERDDIIGIKFTSCFSEPSLAEVCIKECHEKGFVKDFVLYLKNGEKKMIPVSLNVTLYKDENGIVQGIFASARDISETQKLLAELDQVKNYTRSLIESSLDLMVTIDAKGKIRDVNEAAAKTMSLVREEMIGTAFSDYFIDSEKASKGVKLTFEKGMVRDYELVLRTNNRERKVVVFNASLFNKPDGSVGGIFATAREL